MQFETPILYLIFNRPDLVRRTFPSIKSVQPKQLYIAADGPRENHPSDFEKCLECRDWVLSEVDWKCDVELLFRDENLGCATAVSQAVTWFFNNVEKGIIVEDDIFATSEFFNFCEEALDFYQNEKRISHISGSLVLGNIGSVTKRSIVTKYANVWGWASWRDRWQTFQWQPERLSDEISDSYRFSSQEREWWENVRLGLEKHKIDSWAWRWQFTIWNDNGLCINTSSNLIENIGFGEESTHLTSSNHDLSNIKPIKPERIGGFTNRLEYSLRNERKIFRKAYAIPTSNLNKIRNLFYRKFPVLTKVYHEIKKQLQ